MAEAHIVRLIRLVALTVDTEIDCGECTHLSAGYVEALLTGRGGDGRWVQVQVHLTQCPVCAEEVDQLFRLTKLEMEGSWPSLAALLDRVSQTGLFS